MYYRESRNTGYSTGFKKGFNFTSVDVFANSTREIKGNPQNRACLICLVQKYAESGEIQ